MRKLQLDKDKHHCACGIFGIYGHPQASLLTYYGLHALQHRGQEASGIVTSDYDARKQKHHFNIVKGMGLVTTSSRIIEWYKTSLGSSAIGHNRYSTRAQRINVRTYSLLSSITGMGIRLCSHGTLPTFGHCATNYRKREQSFKNIGQRNRSRPYRTEQAETADPRDTRGIGKNR